MNGSFIFIHAHPDRPGHRDTHRDPRDSSRPGRFGEAVPIALRSPSSDRVRAITLNPLLTPREKDILMFLTEGLSNQRIAAELDISASTVKNHLRSIYLKLGVSNRTQAGLAGLRMFPILQVLTN